MVVYFHDKILLQLVTIHEARCVAALSFYCHKSVNHLDLTTNEYGLRENSIFTREGIRKWIQPRTEILYRYNLELPAHIQKYYPEKKFTIVREEAFHQYKLVACNSVYHLGFQTHIVQAITQSTNKIEKLRKCMKIIKLLDFNRFSPPAMYLYDNIFPILIREGCRDSELVLKFARLFSFYQWITTKGCAHILLYVLETAHVVNSSLSLFSDLRLDPVSACFLQHKGIFVPILLRFGLPSAFPRTLNYESLLSLTEKILHRTVQRHNADQRRAFFLLQLFYDYQHHRNSPEGLCCLWKCISDPFLSYTEITYAFRPTFKKELVASLILYYQRHIIGKVCSLQPSPRPLKDMCRVEVRRLLNLNRQLPFGVYNLQIPNELKLYINLFI